MTDESKEEEEEEETKEIVKIEFVEDDISEKDYERLKAENPAQVAENWQLERLARRKNYLEKQLQQRKSEGIRDKIILRIGYCDSLTEAFKRKIVMPSIGRPQEKLPTNASQEE